MSDALSLWLGFSGLVLLLLVVDLGWLSRRSHVLGMREAATWSGSLVALALLFGLVVLAVAGPQSALEYWTGYVIELSLSVDNLFVFLLIFQYFAVPAAVQPRVLKWGILGAIFMRGVMITAGALLLERFEWILYVFGAVLVLTGVRMFLTEELRIEPEKNPIVKLSRRFLPLTPAYAGEKFFVRGARGWAATPLFLVLVFVEWSDLVFAIDSIPAIFAVTRDPFIVFSSNVFAILGLRALFFVLAGMMDRFCYLKAGVALVLVFIGAKMLLVKWVHVPTALALGLVLLALALSVGLSWRHAPPSAGAAAKE